MWTFHIFLLLGLLLYTKKLSCYFLIKKKSSVLIVLSSSALNFSETSHSFGLFSKIDVEPSDWFVFRCKYGCGETTETQVKSSTQVKYCQESTTKVSVTGFR